MGMNISKEEFENKLSKLKFLFIDVDGVMTDGGIYYFDSGERARRFHMHDGKFHRLKEIGIEIGFCTSESDNNIMLRAEKLNVKENSIFGSENKLEDVKKFLESRNLSFENLAYIGDDLGDLEVMKTAGISFSVSNAITEVKEISDYVSEKSGGSGAVREIIDQILISKKDKIIQPRIGIIVAAKSWSSRLPNKPLLKINSKPLIVHLFDRLKGSDFSNNLILATTLDSTDNELVELAEKSGITVFRGSETSENRDLLGSFIKCAEENNLDVVVRICGDSPFIEPEMIDFMIREFLNGSYDYLSIKTSDNKPIILSGWGLAVEVISVSALRKSRQLTSEKIDLEHVTSFIYKNPYFFRLKYIDYPVMKDFNHNDLRLTVDYQEDLDHISRIIESIGENPSIKSILEFLNANPLILSKMKEINDGSKKTV